MTLSFDLYWSFRSPYSYLATARLRELVATHDVECRVRVVLPIAARMPGFFKTIDPRWIPYLMRDVKRLAEMANVPFAWPKPDPIVQDLATREIAAEQPYIHRLTRLGALAAERGRGLAFLDEASRVIWGGGGAWNDGARLADATARAGLDLAELDRVAEAEAARLDAVIADNQDAQGSSGHWGVPLMVFEGEPFFGQDRVDVLVWRLGQKGLARRPAAA